MSTISISSAKKRRELQLSNDLLRAELGTVDHSNPKFKWIWSGELRHPMRLKDYRGKLMFRLACPCCTNILNASAYEHKEGCTRVMFQTPVWEFRLLAGQYWPDPRNPREKIWQGLYAPDGAPAFNRWLLCHWMPPPAEATWHEHFPNLNFDYYRNGTFDAVQVNGLALALSPESFPTLATTREVIELMRNRKAFRAPQTPEDFARKDDAHEANSKQLIVEDLVSRFPMGSIPGKKDSGVEFFGGSSATANWNPNPGGLDGLDSGIILPSTSLSDKKGSN
jgi:hypothetical protein